MQTQTIVGVKELRNNLEEYIEKVNKGATLTVVKRSKPVFKIVPIEDESEWEQVADFTSVKKGGVRVSELLKHL